MRAARVVRAARCALRCAALRCAADDNAQRLQTHPPALPPHKTTCSDKFRSFLPGVARARMAVQRAGLLLAAVACLSGPAACREFAEQCMGMVAAAAGGDGGEDGQAVSGRMRACCVCG